MPEAATASMFDFDAGKLIVIGIVALIVIGPKELPRVLRQVGQAVGKLRRMAAEFQGQFMEAMKEADLENIKEEMTKLGESTKLDVDFNPVEDIRHEVTGAIEAQPSLPPHTSQPGTPALEPSSSDDEPVSESVDGEASLQVPSAVEPAGLSTPEGDTSAAPSLATEGIAEGIAPVTPESVAPSAEPKKPAVKSRRSAAKRKTDSELPGEEGSSGEATSSRDVSPSGGEASSAEEAAQTPPPRRRKRGADVS